MAESRLGPGQAYYVGFDKATKMHMTPVAVHTAKGDQENLSEELHGGMMLGKEQPIRKRAGRLEDGILVEEHQSRNPHQTSSHLISSEHGFLALKPAIIKEYLQEHNTERAMKAPTNQEHPTEQLSKGVQSLLKNNGVENANCGAIQEERREIMCEMQKKKKEEAAA